MGTKEKRTAREEAIKFLRPRLRAGATVYTSVPHVRSGMSRVIRTFIVGKDRVPLDISGFVGHAIGAARDSTHGGFEMRGCGMDMGSAAVYELSVVLFPKGFRCTGERCPSNDHSNGDRDRKPHHHESGGYALRQRWL